MALVNITPVMTSNTAPAPYVVSVSSIYSAVYDGWKALNNTSIDNSDAWITATGSITGWIKIDLGTSKKLNAITICASTSSDITQFPKEFILYGSNDNVTFDQVLHIQSQVMWSSLESRLFKLPTSVTFRYYKLNIVSNNGNASYSAIGEIRLWQDDETQPTVTNIKASMAYGLAKSSTLKLKQKINDPREGMLGFANDGDEYGTLYMVNNIGKAIIPMAALTNADVLFDGIANTKAISYNLSANIRNYKYIVINGGMGSGTTVGDTKIIPVKMIVVKNDQFSLSCFATSTALYYVSFGFPSDTTFYISDIIGSTSWTAANVAISKIYGIK